MTEVQRSRLSGVLRPKTGRSKVKDFKNGLAIVSLLIAATPAPRLVTLASFHGTLRSPFRRCAGLLLPSLIVHAHDEEPQAQKYLGKAGNHQEGEDSRCDLGCKEVCETVGQVTHAIDRQPMNARTFNDVHPDPER